MLKRRTKNRTRRAESLVPLSLFILLVTLMVLERTIMAMSLVPPFTCEEQRHLFVGATARSDGLYDLIIHIGLLALIVSGIEWSISGLQRSSGRRFPWGLRLINCLMALAFLALASKPWAHFHIEHPLSDRLFQFHEAIAPKLDIITPDTVQFYAFENDIWECVSEGCKTANPESLWIGHPSAEGLEFRHRRLGYRFKTMAYYSCFSPEFNRALSEAYDIPLGPNQGDERRFVVVYFDEEGRYVPPPYYLKDTRYLRAQLTPAQLRPSDLTYWELMRDLDSDEESHAESDSD